jgi:hypothetical protein
VRLRQWLRVLLAGAFLVGVVSIVGAAKTDTTTESPIDDTCESAVLPMIPSQCFGKEQVRPVFAPAGAVSSEPAKQPHGSEADVPVEKGDLLQQPKSVERYLTIETYVDGVSELRRVERKTAE